MGITNVNFNAMNDKAIMALIGGFIRQQRLNRNMTQVQLSQHAGINRWTLSQMEGGESVSLSSLIPVLRSLNALHVFDSFQTQEEVDPLERLKLASKKRKRASGKTKPGKPKADW